MACKLASKSCIRYLAYIRAALKAHCVRYAFRAAFSAAIVSIGLRMTNDIEDYLKYVLPQTNVYVGLVTLVSLCVVFHSVQSYTRFMTGVTLVHTLLGDLVDATGLLAAFAKNSDICANKKKEFLGTLVRLVSMLFALCCAEIEDTPLHYKVAYSYDLIDPEAMDQVTLANIRDAGNNRTTYVYQSMLDLILEAQKTGVIACAPPLLTRCFQEYGNGMIKFHECLKFRDAPFPLPYKIVTDVLMLAFVVYTPFMYAVWTVGPGSAGCFTFIAVFCVLLLHAVANELDNPFGHEAGDLQTARLCEELNGRLLASTQHLDAPLPYLINEPCGSQMKRVSSFKGTMQKIETCSLIASAGAFSLISPKGKIEVGLVPQEAHEVQHEDQKIANDLATRLQEIERSVQDAPLDIRMNMDELQTSDSHPFARARLPPKLNGLQRDAALDVNLAGQATSSALSKTQIPKALEVDRSPEDVPVCLPSHTLPIVLHSREPPLCVL